MAGFTALRGDGLVRVHIALDGLEVDPLGLDHARRRFSHSPPPYTSNPSGTTTRSASPNPPSEQEQRREQRRVQLRLERDASLPYEQFAAQIDEEMRRVWNADPRTSWISPMPIAGPLEENACETVKKRWIEQGIWNNKWNEMASGLWKHEEPLELESESETNTEAESPLSIFGIPQKQLQPKPRQPKSDIEKRRIAEQRVVREREREASRPYHQFVYQISKERKRIQEESANGEGTNTADINTKAYENVKNTWTKRGIWNVRWGILPGMSWKHEEPLEEEAADDPVPVPVNPLVNGNHEAGEAPIRNIFGRLVTNLSESGIFIRNPSLVESNHRQASGVMNSSQQGPSAGIVSAGLENGDAEHSPSGSISPRPSSGKRVLRPTTGQALRPSKRKPSQKDGQPASASLGPAHSLKVSKAAGMKKPRPQRGLNISQKVSSSGLPLSSGVDAAEPQPSPDRVTPRRSKRINPPVPNVAKDPTRTASTHPSKRAVRSKPERNVAGNLTTRSSAKPQGISKRQPAKTTRGKARKE
jgi:hypothetical protein